MGDKGYQNGACDVFEIEQISGPVELIDGSFRVSETFGEKRVTPFSLGEEACGTDIA
jgi:hypothetical protein